MLLAFLLHGLGRPCPVCPALVVARVELFIVKLALLAT
jgi:hypothetical protein